MPKEDLKDHIRKQIAEPYGHLPLGYPGKYHNQLLLSIAFEVVPTNLSEVMEVVKKARSSSAPSPNGTPYKLYQRCPQVL